MDTEKEDTKNTQHAFLVVWGWFAEEIGLIHKLGRVKINQKTYRHRPQTKIIEFFVGILAGLRYLQDISRSANPLDMDKAVAEAWGQGEWADYSGVSRTLAGITWEEANQVSKILDEVSRPFIQAELEILQKHNKRVRYDGDLTGIPISNTSKSYPNAAYGHMDDEIRLGYQAGVVSLVSETYGRLWLSANHLPGDTISSTQATALVQAAEAKTGLRPKRRTDLLQCRIENYEGKVSTTQRRKEGQEKAVIFAQNRVKEIEQKIIDQSQELALLEEMVVISPSKKRLTNRIAQAQQDQVISQNVLQKHQMAYKNAQNRLSHTIKLFEDQQIYLEQLQARLRLFEQDNLANDNPIDAEFRLDAGFGTYENIALLIEMGYEIFTKARSYTMVTSLEKRIIPETSCVRVGANAEMVAWEKVSLKHCPYPLEVGLECFHTGKTLKHSALLHFGVDPVVQNLPEWFHRYNGRQTIEAGIKETKQVFNLHKIKVRSERLYFYRKF